MMWGRYNSLLPCALSLDKVGEKCIDLDMAILKQYACRQIKNWSLLKLEIA